MVLLGTASYPTNSKTLALIFLCVNFLFWFLNFVQPNAFFLVFLSIFPLYFHLFYVFSLHFRVPNIVQYFSESFLLRHVLSPPTGGCSHPWGTTEKRKNL